MSLTPVAGMNLNPALAAAGEGLLDLNAEYFGVARRTRRGCRLVGSIPGVEFRGVYLLRSASGDLRALAVGYATQAIDFADWLSTPVGGTVLALYDVGVEMPDPSYNASVLRGLGVAGISASGGQPIVSSGKNERVFFFLQRDKLYIFGTRLGACEMNADALRRDIPSGVLPGEAADTDGFLESRRAEFIVGSYPVTQSYMLGQAKPSNAWRFDNAAWYTFGSKQAVGVSVPIPAAQEVIPPSRVSDSGDAFYVDERVVVYSEPEMPMSVPWRNFILADNGEEVQTVAGTADRWAVIYENSTVLRSSLALGDAMPERVSFGTDAPGSVCQVGGSIVFVGHAGIVEIGPQGSKVVSPGLAPLFDGSMRSPVPLQLGDLAKSLGVPYRIDHRRLRNAVGIVDTSRGSYFVAVTTEGSFVDNDLIIEWNFASGRFTLHHGVQLLDMDNFVRSGEEVPVSDYRVYPGLHWISAAYDSGSGRPTIVFCNASGVYEFLSGDRDWTLKDGTFHGEPSAAETVQSLWCSQPQGLLGGARLRPVGLRMMLEGEPRKTMATAMVYVDGEMGSTRAPFYPQPDAAKPMDLDVASLQDVRNEQAPRWDSVEPWAGDAAEEGDVIFSRPDYRGASVPLQQNVGARWVRVSIFELIGAYREEGGAVFEPGAVGFARGMSLVGYELLLEPVSKEKV